MSESKSLNAQEYLDSHLDFVHKLLPHVCGLPVVIRSLARNRVQLAGEGDKDDSGWQLWVSGLAHDWRRKASFEYGGRLSLLNAYVCKLRKGKPVRLRDPQNRKRYVTGISWHDLILQSARKQSDWLSELNGTIAETPQKNLQETLCGLPLLLPEGDLNSLLRSEFNWARFEWLAEHPDEDQEITPDPPEVKPFGGEGTIEERMQRVWDEDRLTVIWTAVEWAEQLGCDPSTVKKTETWKAIQIVREQMKNGRRKDYSD